MAELVIERSYQLSSVQQGMLFHSASAKHSGVYVQQLVCRLAEKVNVPAFTQAWKAIVERHAALRTSFHVDGIKGLMQRVHHKVDVPFEIQDWRALHRSKQEDKLASYLTTDRRQGFRPDEAPLMRFALFQTAENEFLFVWTSHHALFDGRSRLLLLRELAARYDSVSALRDLELAVLHPFSDYVDWQQQQDLGSAESFWRAEMRGFKAPTPIPLRAFSTPGEPEAGHREKNFKLSAAETLALKELTQEYDLTMNCLLQGAWALTLSHFSGERDLVFGATRACRRSFPHGGADSMIGLLINTLPFRVRVSGSKKLQDWLKELRAKSVVLRAYEHTPLSKIHEWSEVPKDFELFESLVVFENYQLDELWRDEATVLANAQFKLLEQANYPIALIGYAGSELLIKIAYDRQCFVEEAILRLLEHVRMMLGSMVANPGQKLAEIELLSAEERQQLIGQWNQTRVEYQRPQCVHELFEEQVQREPDVVAVVDEETELTFRELNWRANQVAHYLRKVGVGPDQMVGVCLERSVAMVVALLGILKAGGAYVPIDSDYPPERIRFMLEETAAPVVLTAEHLVEFLPHDLSSLICLDKDQALFARQSRANPTNQSSVQSAAYVIYTSGTTGRPKGVVIHHQGLRNLCEAQIPAFDLRPGRRVLQFASLSFDASASEVFTTLLSGAALHLAKKDSLGTDWSLIRLLRERLITTITLPPSLLAILPAEELPSLLTVISAGEACSKEKAARWSATHRFLNAYGPTEVTVCATIAECDGHRVPPLGRPINNTQTYVLDDYFRPAPVGVPGELYVGGAGLARGYLHRPELTAERFLPNPFAGEYGARLYRTGDLARFLPDGALEFLGRNDHQVKIRGFRIELEEINAILRQHPALQTGLVVVREDEPGNQQLVAYYVVEHGELSPAVVRNYLKQKLPHYMIPSVFVSLKELPLTPNGKVDQRALPRPASSVLPERKALVRQQTPLEEMIVGVWTELLSIERIGVDDNFFELGGHSLLAMQVLSRLRDLLKIELPLRAFLNSPTVAALGRIAQSALDSERPKVPISQISREMPSQASFAQQRLWLFDQLEPGSAAYNISKAFHVMGEVEVSALQEALNKLVARHESLRTSFAVREARPYQVIAAPGPVTVNVMDLTAAPPSQRILTGRRLVQTEAERAFNLEQGPLFRATLVRLAELEHVLLLSMHHIVCDGWSMRVLLSELSTLYTHALRRETAALKALPVQYRDYAAWQRESLTAEKLEEDLVYWRAQLAGAPAILDLPIDHQRPRHQSHRGGVQRFYLEAELVDRLRQISREQGATLFMCLQAAFAFLLGRWSGQTDVVIGTPVAGRDRAEAGGLIGCFVNTLALRSTFDDEWSFRELLSVTRQMCLQAYSHQDVPFERLVQELQPGRGLSHTPLFQVLLSWLNLDAERLCLDGVEVEEWELDPGTAKFDLTLTLSEEQQRLKCRLGYNSELFEAETAGRFVEQYELVLLCVAENLGVRLCDIELLSAAERQQLLVQWNQTGVDYEHRCIHELFEEQVACHPNAVAVVGDNVELTYNELNDRANQLAHCLVAAGVGPELLVAICLERSVEMVVALLAVLKAGGAYAPIEPHYPLERTRFIMEETRAQVIVTMQQFTPVLANCPGKLLALDSDASLLGGYGTENLAVGVRGDNAAYVIYTSGSTGRAKGVLVEHRQLVNYANAITQKLRLQPGDRFAFLASFAADLGYTAIFPSLCSGGTLCIPPLTLAANGAAFGRYVQSQRVDYLKIVPSQLRALLDTSPQKSQIIPSRGLILGGEASTWELASAVRKLKPACQIINHYGPTETTVGVLTFAVGPEVGAASKASVPIGRPLANIQAYILDRHLQPVPREVAGELYIGGAGLTRGYLKRGDLTAEHFIPNPFSQKPGERLFRSGDKARYRADGNIEYLGRLDRQVKLRGYRIELGEIEAVLTEHDQVKEAVVAAQEFAGGDLRLVAYIVSQDSCSIDPRELRRHLGQKLPDYMIPSLFVPLEKIPTAASGKIDRKQLPVPSCIERQAAYLETRTPTEEMVARVFSQTLDLEQVGIDDNFFEWGGHSLLAIRVTSRLSEMLRVELPLRLLFEAPTVAQLSALIVAQETEAGRTERIARVINRLHKMDNQPQRRTITNDKSD